MKKDMQFSDTGLQFIKDAETIGGKPNLVAYLPTKKDVPTIGYGHTKGVKLGDTCTVEEAEDYLLQDIAWVVAAVNKNVSVQLNQNQFDAVGSLVFNIGASAFLKSTILRKLNQGDFAGAEREFARWNKQKGRVVPGLTTRRKKEAELFATTVRTSVIQSTTVQASAVQVVSGIGTATGAIAALNGTAQIVALGIAAVVTLAALYVMRERIKKWSKGFK